MKEKLEARIKELNDALEKSAQNHNVLLGALTEVRTLHASLPEDADNKDGALKAEEGKATVSAQNTSDPIVKK